MTLNSRRRASLIAACLSCAVLFSTTVFSGEAEDAYRNAFDTYIQGRLKDSAAAYRYLDALGSGQAAPAVNAALLARDMDQPEEALPLWIKASLLSPTDGFVWNQRGWCYLSLERYHEARDSFRKALDVSSNTVWSTEAQFGLGLTEISDGRPKEALPSLRGAFSGTPYFFPAVASQLADIAWGMREWSTAEIYLKESIQQDPVQPDVLERLARAYEKDRSPKAAWLAYKDLLDADPRNAEAAEGLARTGKYIEVRPAQLLPARRLAAPLLQKPTEMPSSPRVRVGLFAKSTGEPSQLRQVYFMAGAPFRVVDLKLGEVARGAPYEQWELVVPPESLVVEIRDEHHQLQYATRQPFRIELSSAGASVLLKSPVIGDIRGVDIGDRELRGSVSAIPTPFGFQMVEDVGMEEYLFSIVSSEMPRNSPMAAMEAEAILERTRLALLQRGRHAASSELGLNLCDSSHCEVYAGLSEERQEATQAVLATFGGKLYRGSELYPARRHWVCGGTTDEAVADRSSGAPAVRSVWDMEMSTHGLPDPERYDDLWRFPSPSWSRWVRVFDAEDLRHRIEKIRYIGKITGLAVLRRSPGGRVLAMEVQGTKGRAALDDESAVADFFSPGGLRSTLFTLQPLYQRRKLRSVILWGAGTGDGHGLCAAGALGMAYSGKSYQEILSHYFPGSSIRDMEPKITLPEAEAKRPGGSKQPVAVLLKKKTAVDAKAERARRARLLRERNKRRAQQTDEDRGGAGAAGQ